MKLFTLASRAATSMFKKPVILAAFVLMGSLIDRGTDPRAAWCRT